MDNVTMVEDIGIEEDDDMINFQEVSNMEEFLQIRRVKTIR